MVFTAFIRCGVGAETRPVGVAAEARPTAPLQKCGLSIWRGMKHPKEVDRMIERFLRAKAVGYDGVALACDLNSMNWEPMTLLRQAFSLSFMKSCLVAKGGSMEISLTCRG